MRASYPAAITWLVFNDDCRWLYDDDPAPTTTAGMVADLFGKTIERVRRDVERKRAAEGLGHAR